MRRQELLEIVVAGIVALLEGPSRRDPVLVGVDGVDGAGKTVFADELGAVLTARGEEVVRASIDGFHHPRAVRYRRGRTSPEGFFLDSFDLEAVRDRLLAPLRTGGDRRIVRAIRDVATDEPVDPVMERVADDAVVVVDGLFLHRPELRSFWDLSVLLDVPFEVSVPRMAVRDGSDPDPDAASNRRYVEGQRLYLRTCEPHEHATLVVDNRIVTAPRMLSGIAAVASVRRCGRDGAWVTGEPGSTSRFERDTAIERIDDRRYRGAIDPGWAVIDGAAPNGGYVMALAARAMRDPLPHPDPVTLTAHFLAPPAPGEVTIDLEVLRTGRRHSTVSASLRQGGREVARLLGAFGDLAAASGPTRVDRQPPALPPKDECVAFTDEADQRADQGIPAPPIALRFDHHMPASVLGWTRGRPSGNGAIGGYLSWRDGAPMDTLGLLVVADCYPPAVFERGISDLGWTPTIELTVQVRKRPSPGDLRAWFWTSAVTDGYLEEDGEVWDADGDLVVLSRQLALAARPRRD